jgi:hypothetical protein
MRVALVKPLGILMAVAAAVQALLVQTVQAE